MCKDPTIVYLAKFGYNVIKLPRAGLQPGGVLAGEGNKLELIGKISDFWVTDQAPPKPKPPKTSSIIAGKGVGEFDAKVGFSLLETVLASVGLSGPKLETQIQGAKTIEFAFGDPQVWSLPPVELGEYLGEGSLPEKNPVVSLYFGDDKPYVHIITDLLTSPSLSVRFNKDGERSLDINLDALQKAVDCAVELESKSEVSSTVRFKGEKRLAFGFRAMRARFQDGQWEMDGFPKPGSAFLAEPPPPSVWASVFELGEVEIQE